MHANKFLIDSGFSEILPAPSEIPSPRTTHHRAGPAAQQGNISATRCAPFRQAGNGLSPVPAFCRSRTELASTSHYRATRGTYQAFRLGGYAGLITCAARRNEKAALQDTKQYYPPRKPLYRWNIWRAVVQAPFLLLLLR
jgi:hypothetical protein